MKRGLSLKKNASKNQKPITQFFKGTNDVVSSHQDTSNHEKFVKTVKISGLKQEEKSSKRKADDFILEDKTANGPSNEINKQTTKKHKLQSPKKENGYTEIKKEIKLEKIDEQNSTNSQNARSPLSTVNKKKLNHVESMVNYVIKEESPVKSPEKCNSRRPSKNPRTPQKSLKSCEDKEIRRSPRIAKLLTPDKSHTSPINIKSSPNKIITSPSKINSTPSKIKSSSSNIKSSPSQTKLSPKKDKFSPIKRESAKVALNFDDEVCDDLFGDDWGAAEVEDSIEDLDLSTMQRCEVISITNYGNYIELQLKNIENKKCTCVLEGIWCDTPLSPSDIISVIATRNSSGKFVVSNNSGLLVLRPDHLMSTTSVVAGVFCKRKAVLQERFKGIDSANTAMTIGILIHELVQKALTDRITDVSKLRKETQTILNQSTEMLYDAGISVEEAAVSMEIYIEPLSEFMQCYVLSKNSGSGKMQKDKWNGLIDKVLDIEENVCCPQLGLKGKIDATLEVTIHERKGQKKMLVPLELKSGRASASAEHRGQLLLYCMMLSAQKGESPVNESCAEQKSLLLYLRERVDLREVSAGHNERRDLIMLRNQLVQYLSASPNDLDPENLPDIEDMSQLLAQKLPEPVHHHSACTKCPYLSICSLHLWYTQGPQVTDNHPLAKLREEALGHLSDEHIKYFLHWSSLLKMEEKVQMSSAPLHALWTEDPAKRSKRGACIANLKLKSVQAQGDRYLHVFEIPSEVIKGANEKPSGPQEGEFSIVSVEKRPWIAAGVVTVAKGNEMCIVLERDLSRRLDKETLYFIDTYESYATTVHNMTNLGVLLEDSDRGLRLRQAIIEKSEPEFEKKLAREVGRLGTKLMKSLNIQQQRAVLKALSAKDYALLQGLPGTGKTQTISVLIQMLVALKQRVLVTAHTHSAVDTVLNRLPKSLRIIRLGTSSRVSSTLQDVCERHLAEKCETPEQLAQLYESMEVVGVTCLGAAHSMLSKLTFDVCIVDEATQVLQSTVIRPLLAAKKFVLVGDPEQLPPVVRSKAARRLGMEESLFHRLNSETATCTLQLQYRMNDALACLANKVAYGGRLKCANDAVKDAVLKIDYDKISSLYFDQPWLLNVCSPLTDDAAIFIDMGEGKANRSCSNVDEACTVLAIVGALVEGGVSTTDVGVIAPYREQVSLLRRSVSAASKHVEVSTVDQFQGRDKCVIIYSCTRSDGQDDIVVKEGEILNDPRRLAVSVTRAKHKFIAIGHARVLRRYNSIQTMIDACSYVKLEDKDRLLAKFKSFVT